MAFIIIFDNDDGYQCPMAFDADCSGAVCPAFKGDDVALFSSKKDARRALTITERFHLLNRAQGRPENTDFTTGKEFLRIVPCSLGEGGSK